MAVSGALGMPASGKIVIKGMRPAISFQKLKDYKVHNELIMA